MATRKKTKVPRRKRRADVLTVTLSPEEHEALSALAKRHAVDSKARIVGAALMALLSSGEAAALIEQSVARAPMGRPKTRPAPTLPDPV